MVETIYLPYAKLMNMHQPIFFCILSVVSSNFYNKLLQMTVDMEKNLDKKTSNKKKLTAAVLVNVVKI